MLITEKIIDLNTGEETLVEREETKDEKKAREAYEALLAQEAADIAEKKANKAALLTRLGITEDEAKLLLS